MCGGRTGTAMLNFINRAAQISNSHTFNSYACGRVAFGIANMITRGVPIAVLSALLTFLADDSVIMRSGWQEVLEKGFSGDKREISYSLWKVRSPLALVLVREALLDAQDGKNHLDRSEENLRSSRVFQTLQLLKAASYE